MDDLDSTLIDLFAGEPRVGVLEASRRLGVARGTVQARLDKLASSGVVTGWGPDLSPEALGYPVTALPDPGDPPGEVGHGGHDAVGAHLAGDPRGAGGAHDHRRRGHVGAGRRPLQHRPPAGDRPGAENPAIVRCSTVIALATQVPYRVLPLAAVAGSTAGAER